MQGDVSRTQSSGTKSLSHDAKEKNVARKIQVEGKSDVQSQDGAVCPSGVHNHYVADHTTGVHSESEDQAVGIQSHSQSQSQVHEVVWKQFLVPFSAYFYQIDKDT
ncbi:hypothetical protein Tco_0733327 [Tanacetum coccineum]